MHSCRFTTQAGPVTLHWNSRGITRLNLPQDDPAAPSAASAAFQGAAAVHHVPPPWLDLLIAQIVQYFAGDPQSEIHCVPVDLAGVSPFTTRALGYIKEHLAIGSTMSYGEIADALGSPGAARAVGRAMATNPIPLIIPCHRVLAAHGGLGGYSGGYGLATKRLLLRLEKVL